MYLIKGSIPGICILVFAAVYYYQHNMESLEARSSLVERSKLRAHQTLVKSNSQVLKDEKCGVLVQRDSSGEPANMSRRRNLGGLVTRAKMNSATRTDRSSAELAGRSLVFSERDATISVMFQLLTFLLVALHPVICTSMFLIFDCDPIHSSGEIEETPFWLRQYRYERCFWGTHYWVFWAVGLVVIVTFVFGLPIILLSLLRYLHSLKMVYVHESQMCAFRTTKRTRAQNIVSLLLEGERYLNVRPGDIIYVPENRLHVCTKEVCSPQSDEDDDSQDGRDNCDPKTGEEQRPSRPASKILFDAGRVRDSLMFGSSNEVRSIDKILQLQRKQRYDVHDARGNSLGVVVTKVYKRGDGPEKPGQAMLQSTHMVGNRLDSSTVQMYFGPYINCFKDQYYFWPFYDLIRRLFATSFVLLVRLIDDKLALLYAILVSIGALAVHSYYSPYVHSEDNQLQLAVLVNQCIIMAMLMQGQFHTGSFPEFSGTFLVSLQGILIVFLVLRAFTSVRAELELYIQLASKYFNSIRRRAWIIIQPYYVRCCPVEREDVLKKRRNRSNATTSGGKGSISGATVHSRDNREVAEIDSGDDSDREGPEEQELATSKHEHSIDTHHIEDSPERTDPLEDSASEVNVQLGGKRPMGLPFSKSKEIDQGTLQSVHENIMFGGDMAV
ncbi:hypothetical protein CYMTET_39945 [Cymbomonas tetramitiformis]|uniref:Uncharacterized protein n=1 Tax=Cymbomonas tetramitiformis TaxID=36881 RepID=A0AAE0C937_9CHLO|nr:hypothetical protein CYMTET_39945 [Cymbomonas tetramitiformis]